ncbi:MAG: hypothetical protein QNJ85_07065 [Gammaproteobacteria bacterium]|nr:hypothetical protein [Gammaproteobacteria bacterium]
MSETQNQPEKLFWYRVKLVTLIVVFASPFIGGWLAFYVFELRPESGNYGQLVQPVRKIEWPLLTDVNGNEHVGGFGRKWTFVLFAQEGCAERCYEDLYYMRQIRTLLGRDTARLQNLFVSGRPLSEETRAFLREYPNLVVIEDYRDDLLLRQFSLEGEAPVGTSEKLYLVDPDRNFMMHYPAVKDQDRVLEDIRKLLKLSRIG